MPQHSLASSSLCVLSRPKHPPPSSSARRTTVLLLLATLCYELACACGACAARCPINCQRETFCSQAVDASSLSRAHILFPSHTVCSHCKVSPHTPRLLTVCIALYLLSPALCRRGLVVGMSLLTVGAPAKQVNVSGNPRSFLSPFVLCDSPRGTLPTVT
jgi:hypothetical protein